MNGTDSASSPFLNVGPLFSKHELTLSLGTGTEAGAFLYSRSITADEESWALSPLMSGLRYPKVDANEFDLLYPLFTYDRYGPESRWQIFQIFNFNHSESVQDLDERRFTLFPFYYQQRSSDPKENYTALWPFYGHLRNRLFYAEIDFALWPVYVRTRRVASATNPAEEQFLSPFFQWRQTRRVDVTTHSVLAPIFHWRTGPGLKGWQAWPLVGWEKKEITHRTNHWDEVELVGGYQNQFIIWPLFMKQTRKIGTPAMERFVSVLPLYSRLRSGHRDSTTYLWPIGLTITDDRARQYKEVGAPWPFIVFARGEGKTTSRVFPFYSHAENESLRSDFILWPLYKYNEIKAETYERRRSRLVWFLFQKTVDDDLTSDHDRHRLDLWPLFVHSRDFNGDTRLQLIAPIESLLPRAKSIERNYAPLWSVWRSEHNAKTGARSQSLLWNLYRHEARPGRKKCSLLFGLFQYHSDARGKSVRLFFIPVKKPQAPRATESSPAS